MLDFPLCSLLHPNSGITGLSDAISKEGLIPKGDAMQWRTPELWDNNIPKGVWCIVVSL